MRAAPVVSTLWPLSAPATHQFAPDSDLQQDAEQSLAAMQRSTEQELNQLQQAMNDSINAFIADYNKSKGYDAILFRHAGVYFNPALDITDEVVEGLNARYNKVETSKD